MKGAPQKAHHCQQALDRLRTAAPASRDADDDRHDAAAAATRGHDLQAVLWSDLAAFSSQAVSVWAKSQK